MYDFVILGNPFYNSFETLDFRTDDRILSGPAINIAQTIAKMNVSDIVLVGAIGSEYKTQFLNDVGMIGIPEYHAIESPTTSGFHIHCDEGGTPNLQVLESARSLRIRDIPEEFLRGKHIILAPGFQEIDSELIEWISGSTSSTIILDAQGMAFSSTDEGHLIVKPNIGEITKAMKYVDVVKMERSLWRLVTDETDPLLAAEFLVELGPKIGIAMISSMGAIVYDGADFYIIPLEKNTRRNVLGATDAFLGAFVVGMMRGSNMTDRSALASSAASIVMEANCANFELGYEELMKRKGIVSEKIAIR